MLSCMLSCLATILIFSAADNISASYFRFFVESTCLASAAIYIVMYENTDDVRR